MRSAFERTSFSEFKIVSRPEAAFEIFEVQIRNVIVRKRNFMALKLQTFIPHG
jgi:hypothetical protein